MGVIEPSCLLRVTSFQLIGSILAGVGLDGHIIELAMVVQPEVRPVKVRQATTTNGEVMPRKRGRKPKAETILERLETV